MTRRPLYSFFGILAVLVIGLFPLPAFAQGNPCGNVVSVYSIICNISQEFGFIPRVMAIFCYVGGVILTMIGLLNLRSYSDDPSSMPLRSIVMKFITGALLISIPLTINIMVGTVLGNGTTMTDNQDQMGRPCSYSDTHSLLVKSGRKAAGCGQ